MKKIILLSFLSFSLLANTSATSVTSSRLDKIAKNFNFNYFTKYTGAALGGKYNSGTTYNRFDGGVQDGKDFDTTGSYQLYQSFRLGYKLSPNYILSYGVTFQENLTKDVEFENIYGQKAKRDNGKSYNNHRVSLYAANLLSTSIGWMSASFFYEIPNQSSRESHMQYGIGAQPSFFFFSKINNLNYGINSSFEKYFYTKEAYNPQGVKISAGPFVNYRINNRLTLKNSLEFDWDQKGSEVGTTRFGHNMHDVGTTGLSIKALDKVFVDFFVGYSISEMSMANTAMGASLDISI